MPPSLTDLVTTFCTLQSAFIDALKRDELDTMAHISEAMRHIEQLGAAAAGGHDAWQRLVDAAETA